MTSYLTLEAFSPKHGAPRSSLGEPFDPNVMEAVKSSARSKDEVVSVYAPAILRAKNSFARAGGRGAGE